MKELLIWFSAWLPLITITPIINNHLIRPSDFVEFPLIFHFGKKPFVWRRQLEEKRVVDLVCTAFPPTDWKQSIYDQPASQSGGHFHFGSSGISAEVLLASLGFNKTPWHIQLGLIGCLNLR